MTFLKIDAFFIFQCSQQDLIHYKYSQRLNASCFSLTSAKKKDFFY